MAICRIPRRSRVAPGLAAPGVVRSLLPVLLLACSPALASPAWAQERTRPPVTVTSDVWTDLEPGIRYLLRTTDAPGRIYALVIDRTATAATIVTTPYEDRWSTVSDYAASLPPDEVIAVTNGGFWSTFQRPLGITASGGLLWPTSAPDEDSSTFWVDHEGVPHLSGPDTFWDQGMLARVEEAVGGRPMLVEDGALLTSAIDPVGFSDERAPRTAIGIGERARTMIVVVADGRQPSSRGLTLYELGRLMIELGAVRAMNLDGGGCSEMVVPALGGVVNVPARGRWEIAFDGMLESLSHLDRTRESEEGTEVWVHGREREVMSHLALVRREGRRGREAPVEVVPDPTVEGRDSALVPGITPPSLPTAHRPERPWFSMGQAREWVLPALYLGIPLGALLLSFYVLRALGRALLRLKSRIRR